MLLNLIFILLFEDSSLRYNEHETKSIDNTFFKTLLYLHKYRIFTDFNFSFNFHFINLSFLSSNISLSLFLFHLLRFFLINKNQLFNIFLIGFFFWVSLILECDSTMPKSMMSVDALSKTEVNSTPFAKFKVLKTRTWQICFAINLKSWIYCDLEKLCNISIFKLFTQLEEICGLKRANL